MRGKQMKEKSLDFSLLLGHVLFWRLVALGILRCGSNTITSSWMVLGKVCILVSCYLKCGPGTSSGWELVKLQDLRPLLESTDLESAF